MDDHKTVTATFTQDEYTLTVSTVGSGSVGKSPDQATYHYDDVVTLTPIADAGWTFDSWSDDATGFDDPLGVIIDGDTSITATFTQDEYTLTVTTVGDGSVGKSPDQATYLYGDSVTLTATAAEGWLFNGWSGDLTSSVSPDSITMDGDKTVTATFTLIPLPYLFSDGYESGNFDAWTGTAIVSGVADVTSNNVYAGVYSGQFDIGAGTGGTARRAYSHVNLDNLDEVYAWAYVYIPADLSLASGQKLFVIQFEDTGDAPLGSYGVIADASGMRWAVQYSGWPTGLGTALPAGGGWYLLEAYFTHASSGPTLVLTVDETEVASLAQDTSSSSMVAAARFGVGYYTGAPALTVYVDDVAINTESTPETYTLTVNIVGNGDVTIDPDLTTYTAGTEVELTAVADPGWTFSGWSDDLSGSINPETVTMDSDYTVTATFTEETAVTYTITASAGAGGQISPTGEVTVTEGDDQMFTITADPGYVIADVQVDTVSIGAQPTYTFPAVDTDHTIAATFTEQHGPVVDGVGVWSYSDIIWVSQGGQVAEGDQIRIIAYVSNPVEPVSISYGPSGDPMTTVTASYQSTWNYYYIDWTIPSGATLGLYDVQVDSGTTSTTKSERFEVVEATP